jgi:hypothetical protein
VLRWKNHPLDAGAASERVVPAKQLEKWHERGSELGLGEKKHTFYDAICQNGSAVFAMGEACELIAAIGPAASVSPRIEVSRPASCAPHGLRRV